MKPCSRGVDSLLPVIPIVFFPFLLLAKVEEPPFQGTEIRVGEMSDTTAIIWARSTSIDERMGSDGQLYHEVSFNP